MNGLWRKMLTLAVLALLAGSARAESLDALVVSKGATRDYPLAYTTVELCRTAGGRCRRVTTGRDGRFYMSKLASGRYRVQIFLPGRPAHRTAITVLVGRTSFVKINVSK